MRIPAKAEVVEFMGDEELIHARVAGGEILAIVSSDHRLKPGDQVEFWLAMDKLHLFDTATEQALLH